MKFGDTYFKKRINFDKLKTDSVKNIFGIYKLNPA